MLPSYGKNGFLEGGSLGKWVKVTANARVREKERDTGGI